MTCRINVNISKNQNNPAGADNGIGSG